MSEQSIGFVNAIRRKDFKLLVTVVLNYQELADSKMVMGEFLIVRSGATRRFLARVEDGYYAPIQLSSDETNKALSTGQLNRELDQSSVKFINFMHYDLAVLGEMNTEKGLFFAGVREIPSLIDVKVYRPITKELQEIVDAKVGGGSVDTRPIELGLLQYGTKQDTDGKPALPKSTIQIRFDISNLHPKRTAVFGKTGFGKSNLIKTLIASTHEKHPELSQLVFDVNGEYAFSNKQGKGLIDIFKEANKSAKIVVYSNRTDAQVKYNVGGASIVKPIKFDVIENPELAVSLVAGKRKQGNRNEAGYLDALQDPDMHPTVRAFWRCFCVEELGLKTANHVAGYKAPAQYLKDEKVESSDYYINEFDKAHAVILKYAKSDTATNLKGKTGQFSFLRRMHYLENGSQNSSQAEHGNFTAEVKNDISAGKIIIIDLPSLDSNLLAPLSDKIASNIFAEAQGSFLLNSVSDSEKNSERESSASLLMYVEEAHNVLSDEQNTIFPRIAREGRKYGIGLVYSTQRPGSIDEDILTQTENFFVMHLGSEEDVTRLRKAKVAFASPISDFILTEPAVGVAFIYAEPYQPYVLSCQVKKFDDVFNVSSVSDTR